MSSDDFASSLNQAQADAVYYRGGPLLVQAGPGTGKTRVLSFRIASLLQSGELTDDGTVLAITFTNQAAAEISSRVMDLPGRADMGKRVQVATFHSWAFGFLKQCMGDETREVIGEVDAVGILSHALREAGLKENARRIHGLISAAKQYWPLVPPENQPDFSEYLRIYSRAMELFGLWDFDDLIIEAIRLLEHPENTALFRKGVSCILVDEFQDVSPAQYALLRLMVPPDGNVTVIGDANQAIYGFRGASPEFMVRFKSDFTDVREVILTDAYRSPQRFLDAARCVIGAGSTPRLMSRRGPGPEIVFKALRDVGAEARWIALEIEKNVGGLSFDSMNAGTAGGMELRSLEHVAVLFRTRRIGDMVARALFEEGIPYQLSAAPDPLEQPELRNIWRLWEAVRGRAVDYHLSRLPGRRKKWVEKGNMLRAAAAGLSPDELIKTIARVLEIDIEMPEVAGLMEAAARHPEIDSLTVLLRDEVDIIRSRTEAVSLLSLHASKGLEFPIVFIAGCDEEIIPWKGSPIGEETRLFYVGLTRASEKLYLTYPRKRQVNGALRPRRLSRFIRKIPEDMRMTPVLKKAQPKRTMRQRQKSLF